MKALPLLLLTVVALLAPLARAHEHIAAAVTDTNGNLQPDIGEPLRLVSPSISGTTSSKIYHLLWRNPGQNYGGHYSLDEFARALYPDDYFTFISWSDGQTQGDGPVGTAYHPPTGANIYLEVVSVTGPVGGSLGFWESGASSFQTTPTRVFPVGVTPTNNLIQLSEPDTELDPPDRDPYGHRHNRGWTVNIPGHYFITFRLRDLSGLGPGGGPLAATSPNYTFHFSTDVVPPQIVNVPTHITVVETDLSGAAVNYTMPTATDDFAVNSLTTSKASGTTFSQGQTTVTFNATDSSGNITTATFNVTVLTKLQAWRQAHFGITTDTGNAANLFDYDHDGLVNLTEYAFGLNPLSAQSSALPQGTIDGGNYIVTFTRPSDVLRVTYGLEWSTTLDPLDWHAATDTGTAPQMLFNVPIGGSPMIFTRWKVATP